MHSGQRPELTGQLIFEDRHTESSILLDVSACIDDRQIDLMREPRQDALRERHAIDFDQALVDTTHPAGPAAGQYAATQPQRCGWRLWLRHD